jgi:hypothetical protein
MVVAEVRVLKMSATAECTFVCAPQETSYRWFGEVGLLINADAVMNPHAVSVAVTSSTRPNSTLNIWLRRVG